MTEPEVLQAGRVRPRRAKRRFPIWLLYVIATLLALGWSIAAYWILVPAVENTTGNFMAGVAVAFIAGMAGGCGLLTAAVMTARKIQEA